MEVQHRIKQYIDQNGLKIKYVAQKSDISEKRFYRLMNNNAKLTADELQKICEGLDVNPNIFLDQISH